MGRGRLRARLRAPAETVVGAVHHYRIRAGDTLLDVARWFDLGYNEIVDANPGVDPWVPPVGTDIVIPTEWVLPCCASAGIVVNIPELRLFYFRPAPGDPQTTLVTTYPVGLGRDDWRTPRGKYRVQSKQVKPTWYIPESIRREHIEERGDARHSIPGGAPDNPLGGYRLQLSHSLYGIHGTDIPWGVGSGEGGRARRHDLRRGAPRHLSLRAVPCRRGAHRPRAREARGSSGRAAPRRRAREPDGDPAPRLARRPARLLTAGGRAG